MATVATAPNPDPAPPARPAPAAPPRRERVLGYDVARALAILGMVLVHVGETISWDVWDGSEPDPLVPLFDFLDGRAAATFIVLAGVGLSLRWPAALQRRDTADDAAGRRERIVLIRRGLFLLAVGFLNLVVWPGDILRVYGVSLLVLAWFLGAPGRWLWAAAAAFMLGFLVLFGALDYEANWDWDTLEYTGMWSADGAARHLFYDGFRSVFPWTGLMFYGAWLGRRDLRDPDVRGRVVRASFLVFLAAGAASLLIVGWFERRPDVLDPEAASAPFGTGSMPPMPLFMISTAAAATLLVALCVGWADARPRSIVVRALAATGQLAFTWYLAHIAIIVFVVEPLDPGTGHPMGISLAASLAAFAIAAAVSLWCRGGGRTGPMEWLMRRVAG